MRKVLIWLIQLYRYFLSPLLGQNCRFYPSCSKYAQDALHQHGVVSGVWLAVKRLSRCHPWNEGGVDFVPEKQPAELKPEPVSDLKLEHQPNKQR